MLRKPQPCCSGTRSPNTTTSTTLAATCGKTRQHLPTIGVRALTDLGPPGKGPPGDPLGNDRGRDALMPAGCFSEVSLRLAVSLAGSHSLPFPFPTRVGEINLPHPSEAGVSREARPRPLFALLGTWAHRWIAGACLRCSPEGKGFGGWLPLPGVNLVWPPKQGLNRNLLFCGDFASAL